MDLPGFSMIGPARPFRTVKRVRKVRSAALLGSLLMITPARVSGGWSVVWAGTGVNVCVPVWSRRLVVTPAKGWLQFGPGGGFLNHITSELTNPKPGGSNVLTPTRPHEKLSPSFG